jgi:hypothetical protein
MRKHVFRVILLLAASIMFASVVHAEVKFDAGADFRLRQEIWDNTVTLNTLARDTSGADRNFLRLRTRVWGKADFSSDFGAYLKLTNEAKWFGLGPFKSFKTNPDKDEFDPDELIVDNLYVDARNLFGAVDLRIGRQDFIGTYGEGFLIMDGTPGDGSRSFYFNAAKANVKVGKSFNFDLTYITDPRSDIYMPSIHPSVSGGGFVDNKKLLTASNEQAFVAYGRGKIENLTIEPYYIYKTENAFLTGNISGAPVPKLKLNTIGARAVYSFDSWKVGGEFAHQWGEYSGGVDRTGNGGYIFVSRKYEQTTWKPEFDLRFVYLSGDDPDSSKIETWDPLFSRNPYWNELIIYTLIPETGKFGGPIPGYWTNMEILKATAKLNFTPATNLALALQYLWAPEKTAGLPAAMFSNNGHNRGFLPTAILSHKFSKNVDAMAQLEYFAPGNFYADAADNALFFRWQLQVKF